MEPEGQEYAEDGVEQEPEQDEEYDEEVVDQESMGALGLAERHPDEDVQEEDLEEYHQGEVSLVAEALGARAY